MTGTFLPYGRHSIDEADIAAVLEVLQSSHLTQGPEARRFEENLALALQAPYVSAVASGTAALHLAYAALGLGPGDELITTPITFLATANAARLLGAEVRFGDVDEHGNLDPDSVEPLITPRTKGIAAVHFAGMPADMPRLHALAQRHGLWLVEDAAHALGARIGSRPVGACELSDATTFSFHPVKHITTGEGGAVSTRRAELKQKLERLREHGIERRPAPDSNGHFGYVMEDLGWNYRLSDLSCALGASQLTKLSAWVARREAIAGRYREGFAHLRAAGLRCLAESRDRSSAHHLFPVQIEFARLGCTRGQLMGALKARGVGTQVHYIPVCDQPYYRQRGETHCPRAREFYARELSLPMYASMSDADVERVIAEVCEVIERQMAAAVRAKRKEKMQQLYKVVEGKSILITGGTGSFGKAFTKAILTHGNPKKVIVFSRDEQKHHAMQSEFGDARIRYFVGDVRDMNRMHLALRGVELVIHAAGMKHVHICEYNPIEAINTNVSGTVNVIQAALDQGVQKVVGVSTDKAVAPVNLYGASKLCLEKLLVAANSYSGDRATRFSVVRYGNVMGSAGSVIPLFMRQRQQGKLTITDERMTRFWIDMNGAVELVLQALTLMQGGEIFIPKLPAASVQVLADTLAPGIPREVIGIRPGEKLHECLLAQEETRRTKDVGPLLVIEPEFASWSKPETPGTPLATGYVYSSDRAELMLSPEAVSTLLNGMQKSA